MYTDKKGKIITMFEDTFEEDIAVLEEEFESDDYARVYGSLYTDKINELKNVINSKESMANEFNVFALEAGLGKSRATLKIIDDNLDDWDNKDSYLIVRRFKADILQSEEYLQKHNSGLRKVLGITSDNWGEWKLKLDLLKNIRVLIISHQRYIDLCLDDTVRQAFIDTRDVLIIDEKVNFPIYTYSKKTYDAVRSLLHSGVQQDFDKACKGLIKEVNKQEVEKNSNKVLRCEPQIHPKTLDKFRILMKVNIENEKDMKKKSTLIHFMEGLEQWYNTKCVYNNGNISTYNRKHKLWGLKNNMILDASAGMDEIYNLSKFNLIGQERIVDHSNSVFKIIDLNSSKSHLKHNQNNFYPEICEKIKANHKPEDKTLIICHKDNHEIIKSQLHKTDIMKINVGDDEYKGEDYVINWFGNLIGKNEYSNFTQCWIIGTPNLSYEQYLVHYMMYKQSDLGKKSTDIVLGRFKNDEFKAVQLGYISSEIYQSIKRIQRNATPQGDFFIINNDRGIISKVLSQVKGAEFQTIQMDFQQEKKRENKRDNVDRFVEYVYRLPKGMYKKKEIGSHLGITNISRILTDSRVKALLQVSEIGVGLGLIKVHNKYIEKLTDLDSIINEVEKDTN